MRAFIDRIPVTYLAYMLILLGFAFLGVFTFALANGHQLAGAAGLGTVFAFAGAIAGFYVRRYQVRHPLGDDSPRPSIDLLSPPEDDREVEQYLINYRTTLQVK